jgi:hypothetical protein
MASELRKTILNTEDLTQEIVPVPEWGGVKIGIQSMSGEERSKLLKRVTNPVTNEIDMDKWIPELLIATAVDPDTGEQIFDPADRQVLWKKNGAALNRLMTVAARLSGLAESDVTEAKELFDDAQKSAST